VKKSGIIHILSVLLPLAAVCSAGVASFFGYRAYENRIIHEERPPAVVVRADPDVFSAGIDSLLRSVASGFGITEREIRKRAAGGSPGMRNTFTVNAPSSVSLTLFHLAVADSAAAHGGAVIEGVESADGRELSLTLGAGGVPTDTVIVRKR
jgi:hypothetical protein